MAINVCKKLNWDRYQQKRIKDQKRMMISQIVAKKNIRTYFFYKQKFFPNFLHVEKSFDPKMYLKKGIPDDVIKVKRGKGKGKGKDAFRITLIEDVLKQMRINASANKLTMIGNFYKLEDFSVEEKLEELLSSPHLLKDTIYLVLENIYRPQNNNLFQGIEEAEETITFSTENVKERKVKIFLFSFSLFFIERLHNYFLDLLKKTKSVKVQIYGLSIETERFLDIHYTPYEIKREDFVYKTKIILDNGREKISIDENIKKAIREYESYVQGTTKTGVEIDPYSGWEILYGVAVNAFLVYTLVYFYYILDLDRLFDDFNFPESAVVKARVGSQISIYDGYKVGFSSPYVVHKGELLEKIIMKTPEGGLKDSGEYLLYKEDNTFTFMQKRNDEDSPLLDFIKQKGMNNNKTFGFLLFESLERGLVYRIFIPFSVESLFLFFKLVYEQENYSEDFIYKTTYKVLNKFL